MKSKLSNKLKKNLQNLKSFFVSFLKRFLCLKPKPKRTNILSVYFGSPGSGKSTFAAYLAYKDLKNGMSVFSNFPIKNTYTYDKQDLGIYNIHSCRLIIDEAGLAYNNRDFKQNFSKEELAFFKLHRHFDTAIDVFSQGYDDMDKKIRTLAQRFYLIQKIPFLPFIFRREIKRKVGIDELTKDIKDIYYFKPLGIKIIYAPKYWTLFDSWEHPILPNKEFKKWNNQQCNEQVTAMLRLPLLVQWCKNKINFKKDIDKM